MARAIISDIFFLQYNKKKLYIFIDVNTLSNNLKDVLR